ncbi:hypothetical protein ACNI65_06955 [Roseateles sp. So40a]|uniref:hypothetical protein n=1 Tax=Roseateles sp. So40a TaxID=3400226 RepID=UPI003A86E1FB
MQQEQVKKDAEPVRSVGFEFARELTPEELQLVSGGVLTEAAYTPTGNPEADCD